MYLNSYYLRLENSSHIRISHNIFKKDKFTITFAFSAANTLRRGRSYRIAYLPIGEMRIIVKN